MKRLVVAGLAAVVIVLTSGGIALAISDGHYSYRKQHCSGGAEDSNRPDYVEPGCHNIAIVASDGNNGEWLSIGTKQTPDGTFVDPTDPEIAGDPAGGDPTTGAKLYFGADDNLDNGEHDGSPQIKNGPSDGGGIQFNVRPESVAIWAAALAAGDTAFILTHPLPLVDAGTGACADGICVAATSQRREAFNGGGRGSRDAYDYEGKQWDPESCAGPSDQPADCGGHKLKWWSHKEGAVYVQPGVQVYEDPDPQGSPIGPYPLPAAYAGTCGVAAGGGPLTAPDSPVTNRAGQVIVSTGC